MNNKEIGNRIREARETAELTKKELAHRIHVADSTIMRYEKGQINKIKIPVIEAIATALNVNPMWIIGQSDKKSVSDMKMGWKDKKPKVIDLQAELEKLLQQMNADDTTIAMFNGDSPMDEETKELMLASLKNTLQMSKLAQKRKDDHE